jgi:hypothetical protein
MDEVKSIDEGERATTHAARRRANENRTRRDSDGNGGRYTLYMCLEEQQRTSLRAA